jgi:hypothetical protein
VQNPAREPDQARTAPSYLVVAPQSRVVTDRLGRQDPNRPPEPVGQRHAAAGHAAATAVCGLDVSNWVTFPDLPFNPAHKASCRRCAQLVVVGPLLGRPR